MKKFLSAFLACLVALNLHAAPVSHIEVIDGDSIKAQVTIWPDLVWSGSIRLYGIDAPELRGVPDCEKQAGQEAKRLVEQMLLGSGGNVEVEPNGVDSFGRALGRVSVDGLDIGELLLAEGLAVRWGGKKIPWDCNQMLPPATN